MNRFIKDTKKYWKYTIYAAKSQLKTEVANSYLNWIWWILEPFCFMLIYAFVFGLMFHHKELYYNAYIFVGLAVWDFFNRCIKSSVRMVKRNKSIVSKVYLPKHTLIMSDMMVNGFKMLICFAIVVGMLVFFRVPVALLITGLRDCVLYKSTPDMPWLGIWFLISLALSVFGIWNIYKNENTYVKVI